MKTLRLLLIPLFTFTNIYGYDALPKLKWVKSSSEINISPSNILDFSNKEFLCIDAGKINVISADDGSLKRTVSGFSMGNGITHSRENGYVAVGGNKITLLDSSLDILWSKPVLTGLSLASAVQTSDSGFAALGNVNDTTVLVIKAKRNLDTLWTRPVPLPGSTVSGFKGFKIVEVEGGYIACGTYCPYPCIWENAWVSKYSYSGEHEWTKIIERFSVYDMIPIDNGAVLTGILDSGAKSSQENSSNYSLAKTSRFVPKYAHFVHIGSDGNLLQSLGFDEGWGNTVRKHLNTYIIATYFYSISTPQTWPTIIAIGENGTTKWSKTYSNSSKEHPVAQPLSCGDLVVSASDSIYYYSDATGFNHNDRTSSIAEIMVMNKRLFYTIPVASYIDVVFYSLDGKMIYNNKKSLLPAGSHSLSLAGFTKGAYIAKVTSNVQRTMQKRVVIY
ncbi:MAG TPA: T9SS type A sorting domain-containing protein [Chitinispirillaceae bacterium]|nr:T9SS type A sorting domain-containing protein [Chitinispirillaceae bacterium]